MDHEHLRLYDIPFVGLSEGEHAYTYEIDHVFFEAFDQSPIHNGDLYVRLTLDKKKESFFVLDFFVDGTIETECDRCLDTITLQAHGRQQVMVKFEDEASQKDYDDPDVMLLEPKATQFNIAQQLFEIINLQLPMRKTCEMDAIADKTCDPAVIEKLHKLQEEDEKPIDPRWEQLKSIQNRK